MKRILSLVVISLAISCQQDHLNAEIIENGNDLEAISFSIDTINFGDSIRIVSAFKHAGMKDPKITFIKVDNRESSIVRHLSPDTSSLTDTIVLSPGSLAPGKHWVSFHVITGYHSRKEEIEFHVRPVSTDFIIEGGVYYYSGINFSNYYQLDVPTGNRIEIPLGNMRHVALLTGIKSSNTKSHGLESNMSEAWIESQDLIAEFKEHTIQDFKYYFHTYNTDKGECYAVIFTLYPLFKGDGEIVLRFWDKTRRIPIRITDPKDIIKL